MQLLRSALLAASCNERIERLVRSSRMVRPLVSRFLPGETLEEAVAAVQSLHSEGTPAIVTYLGENVSSDAAADETLAEYEQLAAALAAENAGAHLSVKLTQFGWDMNRARAFERVRTVARQATAMGMVVALDMESSEYVDQTIEAYESLHGEFADTALCLQAYLHRTPSDVERLLPIAPYIRLVKGAYREPASLALQRRDDVSVRYRDLARVLLGASAGGTRVAFGSHDLELLREVRRDARHMRLASDAYEIQMLYGVVADGRRALAAEGERTRVLISYGRAWYRWFMRRLAEKPSNLLLVARNLIRR